jgi:hypothetical protein
LREDGEREVEVAVVLHVEVDELGTVGGGGVRIQGQQPVGDGTGRRVEAPRVVRRDD